MCVCAIWKQSSKRFPRYHPETKPIQAPLNQVDNSLKNEGKKLGHIPQKAHLHPVGECVCNMKTIRIKTWPKDSGLMW